MSSLKEIYEDYEAYLTLCQILNRYPVPIRGTIHFIDDQKRILDEYGCSSHEELFELINCVKEEYEDSRGEECKIRNMGHRDL